MPQLDPDAMAACVDDAFLVDDLGTTTEEERDDDPYAPAESLRLRIGEDIDWSDVVVGAVAVLQRDDSTKGAGANPKSAARRSSISSSAAPRSSMSSAAAQRKAAVGVVIGGLPQPAAGSKVARDRRYSPSPCRLLGVGGRARVFAAGGEQQQAAAASRHRHQEEPGSPKVSCLGAVRRPETQRSTGPGMMSRRAWRSWLAACVKCCFSSHRRAARRSSSTWSEADD